MEHILILLGAGVIGGLINAVAGGGAIIMYPALLLSGLSPIVASATSSLVIWPGSLASAYGYRRELRKVPRSFAWLIIPCLIGSLIGSKLLIGIDPHVFKELAPWLVLSAVILLALQSRLHRLLSAQTKKRKIHWHTMPLIFTAIFPLAVYGGFFGVGMGLMVLVVLGFTKLQGTHQLNGVKNLISVTIGIVAMTNFIGADLINYSAGLAMAVGAIIGGLAGAKIAHKVSAHTVHDATVVIGLVIAIILIIE